MPHDHQESFEDLGNHLQVQKLLLDGRRFPLHRKNMARENFPGPFVVQLKTGSLL